MNCRTQVVLAAGTGYLLGRQRKLRWGLLLGAAAAAGRLSRPGALLDHGVRALKATPELGKLGEMGGPLVAATKDAARAAVSGRIGALSDRLRDGTGGAPADEDEPPDERGEPRARRPRAAAPAEPDEPADEPRARRPRAAAAEEPDEPEFDDEDRDDEGHDDEDDNLATAGARPRGRPPVRRRRRD